jgi:DNA-binding transcriptional MerR regulator
MMGDRLWFKIGEAAEFAGVTPRDIRYWEKVIPELRPRRSKGNLRYYHRDSLPKLLAVSQWISQGFAVADCRELLMKGYVEPGLGLEDYGPKKTPAAPVHGPQAIEPQEPPAQPAPSSEAMLEIDAQRVKELREIIESVRALLHRLQSPIASPAQGE